MVVAALVEAQTGPVSWLWLTAYFLTVTVGELYLSPTCLSLFNKAAPVRLASTMVGVWYLSLFLGSYLAGVVGSYWSDVSKPLFFAAMSVAPHLISGLALYVTTRFFARSTAGRSGVTAEDRSRPRQLRSAASSAASGCCRYNRLSRSRPVARSSAMCWRSAPRLAFRWPSMISAWKPVPPALGTGCFGWPV